MTKKSWGARLLAGVTSWRSRKSGVTSSDVARAEQPDHEPKEKTSIKAAAIELDNKGSKAGQDAATASPLAVSQTINDANARKASGRRKHSNPVANEGMTSASKLELSPNQITQRSVELASGHHPAEQVAAVQNTAPGQSTISNAANMPGQKRPKEVGKKVRTKKTVGTGGKAAGRTRFKSPSREAALVEETSVLDELSCQGQLLEHEQTTRAAATVSPVAASPRKQSRLRKPKTTVERVTDEELAELEAENAKLKLLLQESLSAKRDNPNEGNARQVQRRV
ncbi:hypothetical protein CN878_22590 [Ochrobactrum sp. 695/2009]|uniref:Uncharacterized protein n=1 Tax=Brucella intermedia TaxID=94625 RepID=A0A7V6TZ87_9HYPH|nr:hypothetical protein [Brucella intermedia]PJR92472.1 hypothetical protein CN881_07960 [Ochrobactrum sp. 721/2009]PJT15703.1 hypothetical protein CN880_12000 [Ochrobactrum sp. 720/2009]PJT23934.1 hypothetical protein CN879_08925 [Ochrobactrum sp. 715/2009]PJT24078.1 hypothetical protein CN878_22590 [Ochrobactrum sp. 695/2009]PJT33609.1 hypothetical protein CN877_14265 [Ochrobactrum sp. 689/2009]